MMAAIAASRCQNCDMLWPDEALNRPEDVHERVAPGEPHPSGECPACGALCQPLVSEYDEAARRVSEAEEAWRPLVLARFSEQVRALVKNAYRVTFEVNYYDNGPFLAVKGIDTYVGRVHPDSGEIDEVNEACDSTLADITRVMGSDLDELRLES